jgi:hypothetical protein
MLLVWHIFPIKSCGGYGKESHAQKHWLSIRRTTMTRLKITKRIRLFLWLVIAIITAPFALVLAFSSWLQDLVAGDQCPWEKMRGAVPDLTNGLSSEAFVRKQRDEWDSTPTVASTASEISLETLTAAPTEEKKDD